MYDVIIQEQDMAQGVKQKTVLQFEGPLVIVGGGFVDLALLRELAGAGAAVRRSPARSPG